jgi:tetratricopeptide (TPR) repeat protein
MTDHALTTRVLSTWDFSDPAGSLERFTAAAAAEPERDARQVMLTQAARAHGLLDDFAAGDAILDGLGEASELGDEPAARALLERGRLRNSGGDPAAAVPLFEAAYERAETSGLRGLAADAAHMLAIAAPVADQEQWARRGLAIADDASGDPLALRMRAAIMNNLAWTYAEADDWAEALPLFEGAVTLREEAGDAGPLHFARWCRGRALRGVGRYDEALAEQRALADSPEGAGDRDVAEEIAENEKALQAR